MSALTRYPVPQAGAAGAVDISRLSFNLEPTIVPDPVLDFLQPLRAIEQGIAAGAVEVSRLYFSLEIISISVFEFLRPLRAMESITPKMAKKPQLYFNLSAVAAVNLRWLRIRRRS